MGRAATELHKALQRRPVEVGVRLRGYGLSGKEKRQGKQMDGTQKKMSKQLSGLPSLQKLVGVFFGEV